MTQKKRKTRRKFLGATAAAAGGMLISDKVALGADAPASESKLWGQLTDMEQSAATLLGYTQPDWDS